MIDAEKGAVEPRGPLIQHFHSEFDVFFERPTRFDEVVEWFLSQGLNRHDMDARVVNVFGC